MQCPSDDELAAVVEAAEAADDLAVLGPLPPPIAPQAAEEAAFARLLLVTALVGPHQAACGQPLPLLAAVVAEASSLGSAKALCLRCPLVTDPPRTVVVGCRCQAPAELRPRTKATVALLRPARRWAVIRRPQAPATDTVATLPQALATATAGPRPLTATGTAASATARRPHRRRRCARRWLGTATTITTALTAARAPPFGAAPRDLGATTTARGAPHSF